MSLLAPVVIFVYRRTAHLDRLIQTLKQNRLSEQSELIIFSDGPKARNEKREVRNVRNLLRNIDGFKDVTIVESSKNLGLANSIVNGVSTVLENHENIIVLEDDLEVSTNFLRFMNDALDFYKANQSIFSISGLLFHGIDIPMNYRHDVLAHPRLCSTGWATWRNRWHKCDWQMTYIDEFIENTDLQNDFNTIGDDLSDILMMQNDGIIDSWAIRWVYSHFVNNALSIFPITSKVIHKGDDKSGTHVKKFSEVHRPRLDVSNQMNFNFIDEIEVDPEIMEQFRKIF